MTGLIHETVPPGERRTETQKAYDAKVLARVKRGIAWLEKQWGPDWVEHIDLKTLDLTSGSLCVLGQLYGDYAEACYRNGLSDGRTKGFYDPDDDRYPALQACWVDLLTPKVAKT